MVTHAARRSLFLALTVWLPSACGGVTTDDGATSAADAGEAGGGASTSRVAGGGGAVGTGGGGAPTVEPGGRGGARPGGSASIGGAGRGALGGDDAGGAAGAPILPDPTRANCETAAFNACTASGSVGARCGQLTGCACAACADLVRACESDPSCRYVWRCTTVSGCNDLTSCMAAMSTYPDECSALGSHLGRGQSTAEAITTCLAAAYDPGGACAPAAP